MKAMTKKYAQSLVLMLFALLFPSLCLAQDIVTNYVTVRTMFSADSESKSTCKQYYDALGRLTGQEYDGVNNSGQKNYTCTEYDIFGSETTSWLPSITADFSDYSSRAYSKTTLDPLGRVRFVSTPGTDMGGRGKSTDYITNKANSVKQYNSVRPSSGFTYYPIGTLTGKRTTDEDGHTVETYEDMLGHTVLERRNGSNDTYYVYNAKYQLVFVLQPMFQQEADEDKYAYCYTYDAKGRIRTKKIPGCNGQTFCYDTADRTVFSSDGNGTVHFFLYDAFDRMVISGTCSGMPANDIPYVNMTVAASMSGSWNGTGYTATGSMTAISSPCVETVNYYDNYAFLSQQGNNAFGSSFIRGSSADARGMQTGGVRRASNGGQTAFVDYYDLEGNVIDHRESVLGGGMLNEVTDYTFTNNPQTTARTLSTGGKVYTVTETNAYDGYSDKLESTTVAAGGKTKIVAKYRYNKLGLLSGITSPNQIINGRSYNLRNAVTSVSGDPYFSEKIFYADYTPLGSAIAGYYSPGSNASPCYNGNISSIMWSTSDSGRAPYPPRFEYDFRYDGLDRLVSAAYSDRQHASAGVSIMSCSYDKNGSPTSLTRVGKDNKGNYPVKIDGLSYTYNGNQLKSVSGSQWLYEGFNFKDYACDALEYWYDGNGSLTADHNKGISSITYDSHGCPKSILIGDLDTNATVYVYSSDGRKLRTCHLMTTCGLDSQKREIVRNAIEQEDFDLTDSSIQPYLLSSVTTDYVGNFILEDGILSKYLFGNGYVSFSNGSPSFHYYIRDHLGSVRVVTNDNGDAEQVNNYYPFGGEFTAISTNTELQPWKYTGKEYDHRHGLDLYDFGARMYDPATLLWTSVDSRAEDYYDVSPYVFCKDNPVNAIDLDGRAVWTRIVKIGAKVGARVSRYGWKELGNAATYADAVSDITDNANTAFGSDASVMERIGAGVSLASEILPISVRDLKDAGNIIKKILPNNGIAKPHGGINHNNRIDKMIDKIKSDDGVKNIRKNQTQVDVNGNRVGNNRPDIQFDKNGVHTNIEYDTKKSSMEHHKKVVTENDPKARNKFYKIK